MDTEQQIASVAARYGWQFVDGVLINRLGRDACRVTVKRGRIRAETQGGHLIYSCPASKPDMIANLLEKFFYCQLVN